MAELREQLTQLGFQQVTSYINSGNLFFETDAPRTSILTSLRDFFSATYPFVRHFSLIDQESFLADMADLPDWWSGELARRDVLFFTEDMDRNAVIARVKEFSLGDEVVHFGKIGIYWGKYTEKEYLKTAYHKLLIKEPFYKHITIRNANTVAKILAILQSTQ